MCTRANTILVAAFLAAGAAGAQPALTPIDREGQLIEQIAELRAEAGPTPAGLIEPLRALALLYEEDGDHAPAIVALEEYRAGGLPPEIELGCLIKNTRFRSRFVDGKPAASAPVVVRYPLP